MADRAGADLTASDVTERAEAIRALSQSEDLADAMRLVELALSDRSPSVRLVAAGAASEIALRGVRSPAEQALVLDSLRGFDPGSNPSLLLLLASAPDAGGIDRIGRLLRDPRSDVRAGAVAALKHLVARAHPSIEAAVRQWLSEGRHPAESVGELIRMASEAGWPDTDDLIRSAAARGRPAAIAAAEALEWSASRRDPASWVGLWVELDEDEHTLLDWLYLEGGQVWDVSGPLGELVVEAGVGKVRSRPPLVRARLGRPTEDGPAEAFAFGARRLWRQTPRLLARRADAFDPILRTCTPAALGIARELAPLEGANAVRARLIALWRAGAHKEADRLLTAMAASERKVKPELQWVHANIKAELGEKGAARDLLVAALHSGPKKASWRQPAEALLAEMDS